MAPYPRFPSRLPPARSSSTPLESRASLRPRHEGLVPTRARLPLLLYAASHGCPKSGRSVLLHLSSPNRTAERMESPGPPNEPLLMTAMGNGAIFLWTVERSAFHAGQTDRPCPGHAGRAD